MELRHFSKCTNCYIPLHTVPPDPPVLAPVLCTPKNNTHFVAFVSWNDSLKDGGNSIDSYYISSVGYLNQCSSAPCIYNSTARNTTFVLEYNHNYSLSISASNCKGSCDGCGLGYTLGELIGHGSTPVDVFIRG